METGCNSSLPELTLDCLICVFSYLDAKYLLVAAQVNKVWNEAAETTSLWRSMCLQRWTFCNVSRLTPGMQTWKKYYLHRSQVEQKMASGRASADYTCKSMRGHTGRIVGLAYLSENIHEFGTEKLRSIVCTASTDGTVRAWDVQEGSQIWSTSTQEDPLSQVITLPESNLVISTDARGTIKIWNGHTGEEQASFSTSSSKCLLITCINNDKPFLMIGTAGGTLYTLTIPNLTEISRVTVFTENGIDLLFGSPDKQWVVAGTMDGSETFPKIFYSDSLTNPTEDEPAISSSLPINECVAACWLPAEAARLAVVHTDPVSLENQITVFDLTAKKTKYKVDIVVGQVASFQLPDRRWDRNLLVKGHGAETILIVHGEELKVYSISGVLLQSFHDHQGAITSISIDAFRVVTSSEDISLRVYTWQNENKIRSLKSCYHLLGGSRTFSRGITAVTCDHVSIAASVDAADGEGVLRAYSFNL
ncbi:F-box/WD repeat-containing protein 12 [Microcaecilia unicolor]|uniref:F-box/WD repeat-containing protein 12 n=1 Tax=Microcaecilia unicolor TaxID=1415580 RepID=A0A6P7YK35_9AMPH|nr:F-box/WD repeat-containing protein 12 [Microcaecilia unicolor]